MMFRHRSCCTGLMRALILSLLLQFFVERGSVHGQRLKEGCYDAEPITCDSTTVYEDVVANGDVDFNVEDVCRRIIWEVLPQDDAFILFQQDSHAEYLNSIEASEEFCSQMRIAYSHCIFCNTDPYFFELAKNVAQIAACAGQPTLDQVLQDNEYFGRFQTEDDVQTTCQELEVAYATERPLLAGVAMPSTIDLNLRQIQIKHLCPGNCEGGCFDEDLYPPSCDPNDFKGVPDESLDVFAVCNELTYFGFYYDTRMEVLMNTSRHVEYLQYFAGNTTFCEQARQSYSSCLWCAESLCFAEPHRPTCDGPPPLSSSSSLTTTATTTAMAAGNETASSLDANAVCEGIYHYFADMNFPDDLYNYSKHATNFLLGSNHPFCKQAQQMYHQCYWCAQDVPVDFCTTGSHCNANPNVSALIPDSFESTILSALGGVVTDKDNQQQSTSTTTTTEQLDCDAVFQEWTATRREPYTIQGCYEDIFLADRCGAQFCELEEAEKFNTTDYLGATTDAQKKALVWISRVSALFSLCGAIFILQDILKDKKLRKLTYHQLLIGMASFDVITALAWGFATAPIPADEGFYIEGAIGNDITCGIQAFFVQLGFTSVFYNVSLAAYYVLVVVYSWKEFQLVEMKKHFHILPLFLGFGMAFAAIPIYGWSEYGCHITPGSDLWGIVVFVVFPLSSSILGISACLLMVYFKVRGQAAASRKWSFGIGKASQLEQAVFWQCVSYGMAFYISWPILFAVYLGNVDVDGPYGLAVIVALVAPMQGFNNFCVYIRPKLKNKKKPKRGPNSGASSMSASSGLGSGSSNPLNRLMRMISRRGQSGSLASSQWDSQRSVPVLDPSAAIAQRPSGRLSRWSLFSKQSSAASARPSTAARPSGKPTTAALAQWGLQEPAATSGPSAAAMSQWGLQEPAKPSTAAMAQWGLQEPATPAKPSTAAMAQWGLQEPAVANKPSTAAMAQWGLREPPVQPSTAAMTQWGLQEPSASQKASTTATSQLGLEESSANGATKMEDVDDRSTNGDRVESVVPAVEQSDRLDEAEPDENKQYLYDSCEGLGMTEDTAETDDSSESATQKGDESRKGDDVVDSTRKPQSQSSPQAVHPEAVHPVPQE